MIGWLHEAADAGAPVVLNAGAWTHYSYALRDAAALVPVVVEVHLSQVAAREEFRHTSVLSAVAQGTVTGLGVEGYRAALRYLQQR
jgi:3-dehydroquinate dehydratase-2